MSSELSGKQALEDPKTYSRIIQGPVKGPLMTAPPREDRDS